MKKFIKGIMVLLIAAIFCVPIQAKASDDECYVAENEEYGLDIRYGYDDEEYAYITEYYGSKSVVNIPAVIDGYPIKGIAGNAFSEQRNIISVKIPSGVEIIETSAFEGCINLTSVNIPDTVKTIENQAFYNCESLSGIVIPDSVTLIGDQAFEGCTLLKSIVIDENNGVYSRHTKF